MNIRTMSVQLAAQGAVMAQLTPEQAEAAAEETRKRAQEGSWEAPERRFLEQSADGLDRYAEDMRRTAADKAVTDPDTAKPMAAYVSLYLDRGEGWTKMVEQIADVAREMKSKGMAIGGAYGDILGTEGQRARGEELCQRTVALMKETWPEAPEHSCSFLVASSQSDDPRHRG